MSNIQPANIEVKMEKECFACDSAGHHMIQGAVVALWSCKFHLLRYLDENLDVRRQNAVINFEDEL